MAFSFQLSATVTVPLFFLVLLVNWYLSYRRLSHVPGPFLASFSSFWRAYKQNVKNWAEFSLALHEKYGPIVRLGPNTVYISDATAMPTIFTNHGEFRKADSYSPLRVPTALGHSVGSVIDMQDELQNTALKRGVGSAFTSKATMNYELDVDTTTLELIDSIKAHPEFNLYEVLQFFQMDFLTKIAFSENFGNLKERRDVWGMSGGTLARIRHWMSWQAMPRLEYYLYQHPFWCRYWKTPKSSGWVMEALGQLNRRLEATAAKKDNPSSTAPPVKHDLLQGYIDAAHKRKDIKPETLGLITTSTISAGFDTTASTLTQTLYLLCTNKRALAALRDETAALTSSGSIPKWEDVNKLPYLDATFKEVVRKNSYLSIPMERVVPSSGATICGKALPPGTIVGAQSGVVHQDPHVFGNHYSVKEFWPERWLGVTDAQRYAMERGLIGFGAGKRVCLGRHIAEMEIKKTVPALLANFDMTLLEEEMPGEMGNVRNFSKKIMMRFEEREKTAPICSGDS